jgi:hypothetical protein
VPADGSRIEDAFSLYLNYDGAGGRVQGQSVRATSTSVDQVGAYAIVSPSNVLYLLLFNKDTTARTVSAAVAGGVSGTFSLYRFTAATRLGSAGTTTPSGGVLSLTLPARRRRSRWGLSAIRRPGLVHTCLPAAPSTLASPSGISAARPSPRGRSGRSRWPAGAASRPRPGRSPST